MKVTGRVESYEMNNLNLKGRSKPYFINPNDIKAAMTNFPAGMVITLTVEKGTVKGIMAATAAESASYVQDEKAADAMKATTPEKKEEFLTGKQILEQNLKEKVASVAHAEAACAQISKEEQADKLMKECKNLPERCEFIGCAIPGNMPLCLKEWVMGSSYHPVCSHAAPGSGLTTTAPASKTAEKQAQIDSTGGSPAPATNPPTTAEPVKKPAIITPPGTRVTIAATVNLLNYENIRVEIEGDNVETCKAVLKESLLSLAQNPAYSTTRDLIQSYVDRVLEE